MIIHRSGTMLIILEPHTVITVIIHKIIDSFSVLLILEPLTFVLLSIRKRIDSVAFTFSFDIFPFVDIPIFKDRFPFSVRFASFHFSCIDATIFESIISDFYFCRECVFQLSEEPTFAGIVILCHHSSLCKKSQKKCSI